MPLIFVTDTSPSDTPKHLFHPFFPALQSKQQQKHQSIRQKAGNEKGITSSSRGLFSVNIRILWGARTIVKIAGAETPASINPKYDESR